MSRGAVGWGVVAGVAWVLVFLSVVLGALRLLRSDQQQTTTTTQAASGLQQQEQKQEETKERSKSQERKRSRSRDKSVLFFCFCPLRCVVFLSWFSLTWGFCEQGGASSLSFALAQAWRRWSLRWFVTLHFTSCFCATNNAHVLFWLFFQTATSSATLASASGVTAASSSTMALPLLLPPPAAPRAPTTDAATWAGPV